MSKFIITLIIIIITILCVCLITFNIVMHMISKKTIDRLNMNIDLQQECITQLTNDVNDSKILLKKQEEYILSIQNNLSLLSEVTSSMRDSVDTALSTTSEYKSNLDTMYKMLFGNKIK